MRALFLVLLPLIGVFYLGWMLRGFWTVYLAVGGEEDDDIRTVSSGTCVHLADEFDNDDTTECLFH